MWGSDRRDDTSIRGGVEGDTRVGDSLGADRRRQSHGAEGLRQSGLVPTPQARSAAGWAERAGSSTARRGEQHR